MLFPDFDDFVYVNFHPGDYFGDIDFVVENNDQKRTYCVKALSKNCEGYVLNRQDIAILSEEFPTIISEFFFEDAGVRRIAAEKIKKSAE